MGELPPGFRFYPTEEELVSFYLLNQLEGNMQQRLHQVIPVIDVCSVEPWDLPKFAGELCQGDSEQWFFFTPRQDREARGGRPSRTTPSGYWKATGSPSYVYSSGNPETGVKKTMEIGVKKAMVFYKGKAPTGTKTKWKMNEYRAIEKAAETSTTSAPKLRHEFSLCRVYVISGSFRAFDRRPLEVVARKTRLLGDTATSSAQEPTMMDGTSLSETSSSGGVPTQLPGTSASANLEMLDDGRQTRSGDGNN